MKLTEKWLVAAACVSAALCALSFLPSVTGRHAPKPVRAPLVDGDARIAAVLIAQGEATLRLEQHGSLWTANDGGITAPADLRMVSGLCERLLKVQRLYKIADSVKKLHDDMLFSTVSVYSTDGNLYEKIDFYLRRASSDRLLAYTDSLSGVYETEQALTTYMQASLALYAAQELFWGIQTVTAVSFFDYRAGGVQRFQYADAAHGAEASPVAFIVPDGGVSALGRRLLALRHGGLLPISDGAAETPVAVIVLDDAGGRRNRLSIYRTAADSASNTYRCVAHFEPSPTDSAEDTAALRDFSQYQAEISAWTFERLMELLAPVGS